MNVIRSYTVLIGLVSLMGVLMPVRLSAQNLKHIHQKDDYPEGRIYSIYQDKQGYIWLASENGAIRYDGQNFKVFASEEGIPNVDIWDFTIDDQNRIWCHTKSDFPFYIYNDSVHILKDSNDLLINMHYQDFTLIENEIFHSRLHKPILRSRSQLTDFESKVDSIIQINDNRILGILPHQQKAIVYLTKEKGIEFNIISFNQSKLQSKYLFSRDKINNLSTRMVYDRYLIVWMERFAGIIDLWSEKLLENKLSYKKDIIYGNVKLWLYRDSLLMYSLPGRLLLIDSTFNVVDTVIPPPSIDVLITFLDDQDNLWYLHPGGLSMQSAAQRNCRYFLNETPIRNIVRVGTDLILGVELDGFYKLSTRSYSYHLWKPQPFLATRPSVQIDGDEYLLDNKREVIKCTNKTTTLLKNQFPATIKNLYAGTDGLTILGSYLVGSATLDHQILASNDQYYFKKSSIECGFLYKNKNILGTTEGLYEYRTHQKSIKLLPDSFAHHVTYLCPYDDKLLVGTKSHGLYQYDGTTIAEIPFTAGMAINDIDVIGETVWLATDKGVARIVNTGGNLLEAKMTDLFTQDDGLLADHTYEILVEGDTLWAGSENGLSQMPWKINRNIFNAKILFSDSDDGTEITPEMRRNAHIDFSVLNTAGNNNLRVEYRIDGYDTSWQESQSNDLLLPELDPGHYQLQLRVTDLHGHQEQAMHELSVLTRWHETAWVRALLIILGIAALAYIIYHLIDYLKTQKLQKIEQEKQLSEVRLFALRSQMNPHFINNSLNAIQYLVNSDQHLEADRYISKFSQLVRMFFRNSHKQSIPLEEEIDTLRYYLDIEKLRFDDKFDYKIDTQGLENHFLEIPSMLIQPIVENALKHGIFHKKGKGHIDIILTQHGDSLKIQVLDDGVGLEASAAHSAREQKRISSTSVLKERIELLNKSHTFDVDFVRESIKKQGEIKGTRVELNIKKLPEL